MLNQQQMCQQQSQQQPMNQGQQSPQQMGQCPMSQGQQMSQSQLLQWINYVSFAVNDIILYLDTHPGDEEALNYFRHYKELRKQGLRAYADQYGPLTIDSAKVGNYWSWASQPWPWEGGVR